MSRDDSSNSNNTSTKRPLQDEESLGKSKKSRKDHQGIELEKKNTTVTSDQCEAHLKEIERLKQELSQRDQEIANLNKIVVALTRKQGL